MSPFFTRKDIILKVVMTPIVPLLVEANGRVKQDMDMCAAVHMRISRKNRKIVGSRIKPLGFRFHFHQLEAA